jgi:hypothetical protein
MDFSSDSLSSDFLFITQTPGSPAGILMLARSSSSSFDAAADLIRFPHHHHEMTVNESGHHRLSDGDASASSATAAPAANAVSLMDSISMTDDQKQRLMQISSQINQQHHHQRNNNHNNQIIVSNNELAERNQLLIKRRDSINRNWKPFKSSKRDRRLFQQRITADGNQNSPTTPVLSPTVQQQHAAIVHASASASLKPNSGLRRHHSMTGFRADRIGSLTESRLISSRHIPAHIPTPRNRSSAPDSDSNAGSPQSPLIPMNHSVPTVQDAKRMLIHEVRTLSPGQSLMGMFYCSSLVSRKNSDQSAASQTPKYDQKFDSFFAKGLIHTGSKDNNDHEMDDLMHDDADVLIKRCKSSSLEDDEDDRGNRTGHRSSTIDHNCESCLINVKRSSHLYGNERSGSKSAAKSSSPKLFLGYFHWSAWMRRREEWPLFLLSPNNYLRLQCIKLTEHPSFDYVIMIFILANCVTLAMERPKLPANSLEREFLTIANYCFTVIFAFEMAVKVIANGLLYGRNAYLRSGWNVMDAALVAVSLFDLLLSIIAQKSPRIFAMLRVFRLLRSLRPLR